MAKQGNLTLAEAQRQLQAQLEPVFERTGEDMFAGYFERRR